MIAERRGDPVDEALREQLAAVRYLDLASTIARAWQEPDEWIEGVVASFDIVVIDPLSAVASAIDLDFDKSNADYVRAFDRLVQPLTMRGVTVPIVENIGHAAEAKRRAKGASAKGDRADLTFSCSASANPQTSESTATRAPTHARTASTRTPPAPILPWSIEPATVRARRAPRRPPRRTIGFMHPTR